MKDAGDGRRFHSLGQQPRFLDHTVMKEVLTVWQAGKCYLHQNARNFTTFGDKIAKPLPVLHATAPPGSQPWRYRGEGSERADVLELAAGVPAVVAGDDLTVLDRQPRSSCQTAGNPVLRRSDGPGLASSRCKPVSRWFDISPNHRRPASDGVRVIIRRER